MVETDRRDDRDGTVRDVGGVPRAAEADLDTAASTATSANHANPAAVTSSNHVGRSTEQGFEPGELGHQRRERVGLDRLAVPQNPLGHRYAGAGSCRCRRTGRARPAGRDGAAGRCFAVGARHVHNRVAPLRVAQQAQQFADALERGSRRPLPCEHLFEVDVVVEVRGALSRLIRRRVHQTARHLRDATRAPRPAAQNSRRPRPWQTASWPMQSPDIASGQQAAMKRASSTSSVETSSPMHLPQDEDGSTVTAS